MSKIEDDVRFDIIAQIDEIESENPYKVFGVRETYTSYNEGWCDALEKVKDYIENL